MVLEMIYFFDTFYFDNTGRTAVLGIEHWKDAEPVFELIDLKKDIKAYESGSFYKRELPCLVHALEKVELEPSKDILVVDGYVCLSDEGKFGLGGHLYHHLGRAFPVIGVAKNDFQELSNKEKVYRGQSKNPLYVTAIGLDSNKASSHIKSMHGSYRLPTILKLVDQKSRKMV